MPSVTETSVCRPCDSSTETTPFTPTASMASETMRPISGSREDTVATWATASEPDTGVAAARRYSTAAAEAFSMPLPMAMGLAPATTLRRPSRMSAWASTVAVVVPSPAMSLVLVATDLTSWAPRFANGSSSSISRAMDTPSLVTVGPPKALASTTWRPLGPSVTLTVSASSSTPASMPLRASSSNAINLDIDSAPGRKSYRGSIDSVRRGGRRAPPSGGRRAPQRAVRETPPPRRAGIGADAAGAGSVAHVSR